MSLHEIKKNIELLTLEIKSLDPTSKYSAVVHLEEAVDLLKLEALKELPEENVKVEDDSYNDADSNEEIESDSDENVSDSESLTVDDVTSTVGVVDKPQTNENDEETLSGNQNMKEDNDTSSLAQDLIIEITDEPISQTSEDNFKTSAKVVTVEDNATNINQHTCQICQKELTNRRGLLVHYVIHKGKYQCPKCKAPFSQKRELDKHTSNLVNCLKLKKVRAYQDPREWIIDPSHPILKSTEPISENGEDRLHCSPCKVSFEKPWKLRRHKEGPAHEAHAAKKAKPIHNPITSKDTTKLVSQDELIKCPECPNLYSNDSSLKKHYNVHTDKFKCPECQCRFSSPSSLDVHSCETTLRKRSAPNFTSMVALAECEKCGLRCGDNKKQWLKYHYLEHTDKFKCKFCSHGFSSAKMLDKHMSNRDKCKNIKARRQTLVKRSRLLYSAPEPEDIHSENVAKQVEAKPTDLPKKALAECLKCGMRYGKKKHMRYHRLEHTNEFKCHSCSFGFSCIRSLARHLSNKENCKNIKSRREWLIRRSRLLFSSPGSKRQTKFSSDIEKLQLQKLASKNPDVFDDSEKRADNGDNDNEEKSGLRHTTDSEIKLNPMAKDSSLVILNHNFPGITFR